jgi:hypothetical protein
MKERFVRREEFKEYQSKVQDKMDEVDSKMSTMNDTLDDHEERIKKLESGELKDLIENVR